MVRPEKIKNILGKIKYCIETGKYILTKHAVERQNERLINLAEILHVLRTGREEKTKSSFDELQNTWKYAVRGKTKLDNKDVRIIVAFEDDGMLVITVMYVGGI